MAAKVFAALPAVGGNCTVFRQAFNECVPRPRRTGGLVLAGFHAPSEKMRRLDLASLLAWRSLRAMIFYAARESFACGDLALLFAATIRATLAEKPLRFRLAFAMALRMCPPFRTTHSIGSLRGHGARTQKHKD